MNENIVDTHSHAILPDRVVFVEQEGDFEFGADAVRAADEDGLAIFQSVEGEKSAEAAEIAEHFFAVSRAHGVSDQSNGLVARIDVDAGVFVSQSFFQIILLEIIFARPFATTFPSSERADEM